mgnify:CR=1 FL=1
MMNSEDEAGCNNKKGKYERVLKMTEEQYRIQALNAGREKEKLEIKVKQTEAEIEMAEALALIFRFIQAHETGEYSVISGAEDFDRTKSRLVYNFLTKTTGPNYGIIFNRVISVIGREKYDSLIGSVKFCLHGTVSRYPDRGFVFVHGEKDEVSTCPASNHIDIEHHGTPSHEVVGKKWIFYTNKN